MKKVLFILVPVFVFMVHSLSAQQPTKMEKIKNTTQKVSEKAAKTAADAQVIANDVQSTVNSTKAIIKLFEPFLVQMRGGASHNTTMPETTMGANSNSNNTQNATPSISNDVQSSTPSSTNNASNVAANATSYNSDGSANWGCQDHPKYGAYLDGQKGIICDDVDVATQTGAIDVIFTARSWGPKAIYALISPKHAKTHPTAWALFTGEKYKKTNYPVKQWAVANASEIAMTSITGEQFEKVKNNDQLMAVVNQTGAFKPILESYNIKLDGKVVAVRTQSENRMSYALIYIVEQVGTIGSGAYLKVKLKVNGLDANGDGLPDSH